MLNLSFRLKKEIVFLCLPTGGRFVLKGLKYKLKESALVNVNRTDVLSKSIHLGVN